jgi:hypothetical protein
MKFKKPYSKIYSLVLVLGTTAVVCALGGCHSIIDMDKPLPAGSMLWKKAGSNVNDIERSERTCGAQLQEKLDSERISRSEQRDYFDICMLKRGFEFVPKPKDYPNICSYEAFKDSIGCKSARGEYKVEPGIAGSHRY